MADDDQGDHEDQNDPGTGPTVLENTDALRAAVGRHLGYSDWLMIDQDRVNLFADATDDHQWIHVDPAKAADGPFGGPIAHGYLTMALTNRFLPEVVEVRNISMGINYGVNKVRFPAPVPVGSRVRAGVQLAECSEVAGGVQTVMVITVEIDGGAKPAAVVEAVSRYID